MRNGSNSLVKQGLTAPLVVALMFTAAFQAFAGASSEAAPKKGLKDLDTSQPVEIIMYYTGDQPGKQQELWDNFNRLAKAKINTTLKIKMLPSASYRQTYPLLFQSGEVFDLAYAATWLNFAQLAKRGAFMALEDLAPKYAPKLYSRESPTAIRQATVDGHLYALPSLYATYSAYGPIHRADLAKGKPGWNGKMESFADFEAFLGVIKANYPAMEPLQISSLGSEVDELYLFNNGIYPIKGSSGDFLFIDPVPRVLPNSSPTTSGPRRRTSSP